MLEAPNTVNPSTANDRYIRRGPFSYGPGFPEYYILIKSKNSENPGRNFF